MKTPADVRDFFSKWYPRIFGDAGLSEEVAKDFLKTRYVFQDSLTLAEVEHGTLMLRCLYDRRIINAVQNASGSEQIDEL